jgi:hypothetical protein
MGRRRMVAVAVGLLLVAGCAAPWDRDGRVAARPLPGTPLPGTSGLRLLVAGDPNLVVLDVDTGASRPVTGLPTDADRSTHVESVGGHAVVVSRRDCRGCDAGSVAYLVRRGGTAATRLGDAVDVEPAGDGQAVWLLRRQDATRCTLDQVGLDGRPRRPPRPLPCDAVLVGEVPAGLLVYRTAAGGPHSELVAADGAVRRLPMVVDGVAAPDMALSTVTRGKLVALTDLGTGASHRLPWPSGLDDHVMGLVDAHPDGRLVSVAFYPARNGPEQTFDAWLLDLATRRWRQLPDMPLRLAPAKPQLRWTADGRLVLLAGLPGEPASLVAVWRPGQPRLATRRARLPGPERRTGYRFAIW